MTKDWVHWVGHSSACQILLQIVVRVVITSSPPAWTSYAWMSSIPADFPFFNDCTAAPLLCEGWGGHPLCLSGYSSVLMDLHWPCGCTAQSSILSISLVSVALLLGIFLNDLQFATVVTFPCFTVVKSITSWYALLLLFFLRFSSISLHCSFSYPVFFSLFHAPHDVVVRLLVFLRSFRLKSFLSQFSPFVAHIKNFSSDPGFFLLMMFA